MCFKFSAFLFYNSAIKIKFGVMNIAMSIFKLLGSLALFLFGMSMMSENLQKVAGDKLRSFLAMMTSNAFKRVLTGLTVTACIQSSAATTLMVVSFVNAGLLSLGQSIGVIMGANIGTTVSAWLFALVGFSGGIATVAIPLIAVGFIITMGKSKKRKSLGMMIMGFAIMFLGLSMVQTSVDPAILEKVKELINGWSRFGFWSVLICVLIGTLITIMLQSSAATMALTLMMCSNGLNFELGAALVLGENIGTTLTANMAASVANISARRAAAGHAFFNLFGVLWVLILYHPFLWVVSRVIMAVGLDNPLVSGASTFSILCSIAMVHTLFNVSNTCILVGFTNKIVAFVTKLLPGKPEDEGYRLQYIHGGPLSTAELSLGQAKGEILHFVKICREQYTLARESISTTDPEKFDELYHKLEHYEQITDKIEFEIAKYLNEISEWDLSEESSRRIQAMFKIIGELESIGDSGFNIGRILQRRNIHNASFDEDMVTRLGFMMDLIFKGFDVMEKNLELGYENITDISNAQDVEQEINEYRNNLKEEHLLNLENNTYSYLTGVYYIDMINEFEHVGDFMINISEAIIEIK